MIKEEIINLIKEILDNPIRCGDPDHEAVWPRTCNESIARDIVNELQMKGLLQ